MVRTELWFLVELYGLELLDFCLLLMVPTAIVAQLHLLQLNLKLKLVFLLLQLSVLPHDFFVEVRIRMHVLHWIKLMRTIVIRILRLLELLVDMLGWVLRHSVQHVWLWVLLLFIGGRLVLTSLVEQPNRNVRVVAVQTVRTSLLSLQLH